MAQITSVTKINSSLPESMADGVIFGVQSDLVKGRKMQPFKPFSTENAAKIDTNVALGSDVDTFQRTDTSLGSQPFGPVASGHVYILSPASGYSSKGVPTYGDGQANRSVWFAENKEYTSKGQMVYQRPLAPVTHTYNS